MQCTRYIQGILCLIVIGNITAMDVPCNNKLFIENRSGWAITITCKYSDGWTKELPMRKGEVFKEIGCLKNIDSLVFKRRGQVWGMGAANFSLDTQVSDLQSGAYGHKNQDAVIMIDALTMVWKIDTRWEASVQGSLVMPEEVFETEFEPLPKVASSTQDIPEKELSSQSTAQPVESSKQSSVSDQYVSLQDVQQGKIGTEYATKVKEILSADYSKVENAGKPNLNKHLMREFSEVGFGQVAARKTPGKIIKQEKISFKKMPADDARTAIDSIHRVFMQHRKKGLL